MKKTTKLLMLTVTAFLMMCSVTCRCQEDITVTLEGRLDMYLRGMESMTQIISYQKPTQEFEYVNFFLVLDEIIDVAPYIEVAEDCRGIVQRERYQSELMIEGDYGASKESFAAKYANKRVRVHGKFYVSIAGWYYPAIYFGFDNIEIIEE